VVPYRSCGSPVLASCPGGPGGRHPVAWSGGALRGARDWLTPPCLGRNYGMGKGRFATGASDGGAIASGCVAMASTAWAETADASGRTSTSSGSDVTAAGCALHAKPPGSPEARLSGYGSRWGCSDTVTYLWVKVYQHVPWWPDREKAVRGAQLAQPSTTTSPTPRLPPPALSGTGMNAHWRSRPHGSPANWSPAPSRCHFTPHRRRR
jgi:hypothetical protein